jgi:hypothetical protein
VDNNRVIGVIPIVLDMVNLRQVNESIQRTKNDSHFFFIAYEKSLSSMYKMHSVSSINVSITSLLLDGRFFSVIIITRI